MLVVVDGPLREFLQACLLRLGALASWEHLLVVAASAPCLSGERTGGQVVQKVGPYALFRVGSDELSR
jgi:hypothetical protein